MTGKTLHPDFRIGVVGAGIMGRGIAQVGALGGFQVRLIDVKPGIAEEAVSFIDGMLQRAVDKGRMQAADREAALARIHTAEAVETLADCDLVIEAAVERLDIKQQIFSDLETICGPDTVLASNTSALPIAAIGSQCKGRERIAGMHFMNPVPLMKLVEVIHTPLTDPAVMDLLVQVAERMGKTPIRVKDGPAFLVGNCARAFYTEALRFTHEAIAPPAVVDAIVREAGGFRMGPFEVMDLVGLDVNYPATRSLFEDSFNDPRYRPTPEYRLLTEAGMLGRKSGRGFYQYDDAGKPVRESRPLPAGDLPSRVWLWCEDQAARTQLAALCDAAGVAVDDTERPSPGVPALIAPIGDDASTTAARLALDPHGTVAVDTLYGWDSHRTMMAPPGADPAIVDQLMALLAHDGVTVSRINDSPGFVLPRLQAAITNLGCDLCQQGISTPEDLDRGMRLGFNFPEGPLEAGDRLGPDVMLRLVEALHGFYGDDRYRPSPWLRRRGLLRLPLGTPERA